MYKYRLGHNATRDGGDRPAAYRTSGAANGSAAEAAPAGAGPGRVPRRWRGQAIPLLALMMVLLIAFTGLALDVSMLILRTLQQQRAADAAALAGVIRLPEDVNAAIALARNYAGLNGFPDSRPGYPQVDVRAVQYYNTRIHVDITAYHPVYFMRIFGIQQVKVTRSAEAQYAQPVHLGCPECTTYGVGNTVPITNSSGCPNCILTMNNFQTQQRFWNSIDGPATAYAQGDAYNAKYGDPFHIAGGYQGGCPGTTNTSVLNPDYRGNGQGGGYNFGIHINPLHAGNLSLYVYDPARYYRNGLNGTAADTGDTGSTCPPPPANDPHNFYTIFRLYYDNQTPEDFSDDTLLWESPHYIDLGNNPALHDNWMLLRDIPTAWVTQYGDLRLQVVTADYSSNEGVGYNEFALALGGSRRPDQDEAIYAIGNISTYLNLTAPDPSATPAPTVVGFYLADIKREHGGEEMSIRAFDLGDASCDISISVMKQDITDPNCGATDPCYQPYPFLKNWTGSPLYTLPATTGCATGTCQKLYDGQWVTLGVSLPGADVYQDTWWKVNYNVGNCRPGQIGLGVTDRTTWDIEMIGNPIHLVH